ncbi:MAG: hypothetical protein HN417_12310, partial [Desulfobacula sp.]|nr:hypothetical protein [Desulfobacula sp.]
MFKQTYYLPESVMKKAVFFATFVNFILVATAFQMIMPTPSWSAQKKNTSVITSVIRGVVASQYGMVSDA